MKPFFVWAFLCASLFGVDAANSTNSVGELLVPLKLGKTELVSYGLFGATHAEWNGRRGVDLVLMLRNIGAKWVGMTNVTNDDFHLSDAKGHQIKVYLGTAPKGMGIGGATVIHLIADDTSEAPQPWTLDFDSKDRFVPFHLSISEIALSK